MTIHLQSKRRTRMYVHPTTSSYAVIQSGSVTYQDIELTEAEFTLTLPRVENAIMRQRHDQYRLSIEGQKVSTATIGGYLTGTGTSISGAGVPERDAHSALFQGIMGGYSAVSGSELTTVTDAGSMITDVAVTAPKPGEAIGIARADGTIEAHRILKMYDFNILEMQQEFSFTPSVGDPTYGSQTYYLTSGNEQSFEFYIQGDNSNDTWVASGMQGNLGFTFAIGEPVMWSSEMTGPQWNSGSADTLGIGSVTTPTPQIFKSERGAEVRLYQAPLTDTAPAAFSTININSMEISPNIVWLDVPSELGVEGVLRKKRDDQPPVCSLSITLYYEGAASDAYWDARNNQTIYGLEVQIGNTPGNTTLVSFPRCQIQEVQRVGAGELAGVQLDLACLIDEVASTDVTLTTEEQLRTISAFSIHRL